MARSAELVDQYRVCLAAGGESGRPAFEAHVAILVAELEAREARAGGAGPSAADGDGGLTEAGPAAPPNAAAAVSCEICLEEWATSQMVRFGCGHSMCGGCVLQIRSVYDEQAGTSLQDQIDLTYDGTQPSYAAPPRCPYCRHLITADELAAAATASAPAGPPSSPVAAAAVGGAHAPAPPPGLLPFVQQ